MVSFVDKKGSSSSLWYFTFQRNTVETETNLSWAVIDLTDTQTLATKTWNSENYFLVWLLPNTARTCA